MFDDLGKAAPGDSGAAGSQAAAAVAPDPVTAALLARYTAGEKLSPRENGKLGAFAAKAKRLLLGAPGPGPGPAVPPPGPGQPAPMASLAAPTPPDAGLAPVPPDSVLVQRTTSAVLTDCEAIARQAIGNAAREAGASDETLRRVDSAACIPKHKRELMIEVSPDVAAALDINPKHYPVGIFLGCLGGWAASIYFAVQEFHREAELRRKAEAKATAAPAGGPPAPGPAPAHGVRTAAADLAKLGRQL